MRQVHAARDYGRKARLVLEVAGEEEKFGSKKQAIIYYGLHLRYMAVHVFHEVDRRKKDEMLNMAQSCRRICTHRANLQRLEVHKSQQSCCGAIYIPLDPAPPAQLAPWEWNGWLEMCKGAGDIEAALKKLGLIKIEARETVALRLAEASRSNVNVALSQQCNPNISVNPNITGPTTTTNISGPTTTVNPSIVSNNAQTGEGNVQPTVGADSHSSTAAASAVPGAAAAPRAAPAPPAVPPAAPTPAAAPAAPAAQANYLMMPTPQGMMMMPGGSGVIPTMGSGGMMAPGGSGGAYMMPGGMPSGDYAAAFLAAQQQQLMMQQAMMAMMQQQQAAGQGQAGAQGVPLVPPFGGVMPMAPYAMPVSGYPMPQQGSGPVPPVTAPPTPPPAGYPPPADGFPAKT